MKSRSFLVAMLMLVLVRGGSAGTAAGDAGHYLEGSGKVLLHNPSGRAFELELHAFQWWIGEGWNQTVFPLRVTAPDGTVALATNAPVPPEGFRCTVPAGPAGVYTAEVHHVNNLNFWHLESSLDRSVVPTGEGLGDALTDGWFLINPMVPRRWWFWVPAGTKEFRLLAQNNSGRSQREDHGFTLFNPRGQRAAVLWGQANPDDPLVPLGKVERRLQQARVLVEPGAGGRFWSLEARFGDSHNYSDVNLALVGVPPFLARSPEEWFDGGTGRPAPVAPYDEAMFVQSHREEGWKTNVIQHWTPCPSFGDPDGAEILTPARLAFWNPEGRPLQFCMATYLPRNGLRRDPATKKAAALPDEAFDQAQVKVTKGWRTLLKESVPLKTQHDKGPPFLRTLETGKGVFFADVEKAEHFWAYTYPATPAVMVGAKQADGYARFRFEVASGRAWYFRVPEGTKTFSVRAAVADPNDVLYMEVNAPDRTMEIVYGRGGEREVRVPEGLDGKLWHVRVDTGGATRFVPAAPVARFPSLALTLELKGVPGYLAPTWEQWFDPERPEAR